MSLLIGRKDGIVRERGLFGFCNKIAADIWNCIARKGFRRARTPETLDVHNNAARRCVLIL